jgi:PIN domain nuclease of toxin-antitoxin system
LLLLHDKGRVDLGADAASGIEWMLREYPVEQIPMTNEIAIRSRLIDLPHQDPADRFLAATSIVHGMTLITRDAQLLASPQVQTVAA